MKNPRSYGYRAELIRPRPIKASDEKEFFPIYGSPDQSGNACAMPNPADCQLRLVHHEVWDEAG